MVPLGKRRGSGLAKFKGMAAEQLEQFEGVATIEKVASLSRRRGFVFPSSDIYGGLGSSFDFGHYGVLLSQNIKTEWQRSMIQERDDMVALDSAVILNPQVWVASGHVGGFSDPMVDCRTCKLRFRADHLGQSACGKRPSKHPGEHSECDLTEPRDFNLMFETYVGAVREAASTAYLRPETAQGIFVNFKNVTSSLPGSTKNSISICSNSRVRKMKLPGVISLRNDLPIWPMPNGGLRRALVITLRKLMKMPCAVSGRR
jgi:hypothetical protein